MYEEQAQRARAEKQEELKHAYQENVVQKLQIELRDVNRLEAYARTQRGIQNCGR
jgi:hypothetical protein